MGRKKKYSTEAELKGAIRKYLNSISYQRPVVVSVPIGEPDSAGELKYQRKILLVDKKGCMSLDGCGKPVMQREFVREPSVSGLCKSLGISKQTWSAYREDEILGDVCESFMLELEDHLVDKLDGNKVKTVQGVVFNLKNNFGWKDKVDVVQATTSMTMEEYLARMDAAGEGQEF